VRGECGIRASWFFGDEGEGVFGMSRRKGRKRRKAAIMNEGKEFRSSRLLKHAKRRASVSSVEAGTGQGCIKGVAKDFAAYKRLCGGESLLAVKGGGAGKAYCFC
jgi:hypothetical protein